MMIGATDYVGLGSLIAATCAGLVSIIVALRQGTIGGDVKDVHAAVTTSNGATLADLAEKNEARNVAQDAGQEPKP